MKRQMVKWVLLMAIFIGSKVNAQTADQKPAGRTPEQMAQMQTEKMTEHLGLTVTQITTVQDINLRYATKIASIRQSDSDMESKKLQMKELKGQKESEMKSVLTEEQLTQWLQVRDKMVEKKHRNCEGKK